MVSSNTCSPEYLLDLGGFKELVVVVAMVVVMMTVMEVMEVVVVVMMTVV